MGYRLTKDQSRPLSPKAKHFCYELVQDPERRQAAAAIRAGYSAKTAHSQSTFLLRDSRIQKEIARLEKELMKKLGVDQDRVLRELCKMAFSNIQDVAGVFEDGKSILEIDRDVAASIGEITVDSTESDRLKTKKARVKLTDKRAALELLGKHLGMFTPKVEVSGSLSLTKLVEESLKEPKSE